MYKFGVQVSSSDNHIHLFSFKKHLPNAIENDDWTIPWEPNKKFDPIERNRIIKEAILAKKVRDLTFIVTTCKGGDNIISNPTSVMFSVPGHINQTLNDYFAKNVFNYIIEKYNLVYNKKNILLRIIPGPYNPKNILLRDLSYKTPSPAIFSVNIKVGTLKEDHKSKFIGEIVIYILILKLRKSRI